VTYLPGPRAARAAVVPALLAAAVTLLAPAAPAVAARAASAAHSGQVTLCGRREHVTVTTARGVRFVVKNDNYGGGRECLVVRDGGPNFTVTRSPVPDWHRKPQAYPFILRGCSWGTCSPHSRLPQRVSALRRPEATWDTTQVPHGRWDAAFDIWFGRHPMTTGQARGAELMIWLNARRIGVAPRTPVVRIDHTRWYLLHWRACHGGDCWNYVQFRRVRPASGVRRLHLSPFFQRAQAHGWLRSQWWLENIEAGFELWQGGAGLGTDRFWARP
jgi:Glycosyl hydrolase family 12